MSDFFNLTCDTPLNIGCFYNCENIVLTGLATTIGTYTITSKYSTDLTTSVDVTVVGDLTIPNIIFKECGQSLIEVKDPSDVVTQYIVTMKIKETVTEEEVDTATYCEPGDITVFEFEACVIDGTC